MIFYKEIIQESGNHTKSIDHDCKMLSFSSLEPNTTTGGNATIGELSTIALSASITNGITIGNNSIIGIVAVLMKNCKQNNIIMYGVPAKEIRKQGKNLNK